jgi:hypothetical protein
VPASQPVRGRPLSAPADAVSVVRVDAGLGRRGHSVAPVAALLAHQGGWDEMLLVLAPIAVVAALLWIAKRRVDRAAARQDGSTERAPR